ncbi:MAG: Mur ligase family protein [Candidatus Saccharimonas sp.]
MTQKVRLLLISLRILALILFVLIVIFFILGITTGSLWLFVAAIALIILAPFVLAYGILLPLAFGWFFIQRRQERMLIDKACRILAAHGGLHIGIAGSYGKTTAKELLKVVLGEAKKVAATPGNMNTAIGISRFARTLKGDEEVLIFELGEEKVGDVDFLAKLTQPRVGIITGINEAHLSSFKTLDRTVATVFELAQHVSADSLYQNHESRLVREANRPGISFDQTTIDGWVVSEAKTGVEGTSFTLMKGDKTIKAHTQLLGLHTIGITAAVIVIADKLGLSPKEIEAGLLNAVPFEHRMQPRLLHGAWMIDDTYNGNSEGVQAGLLLLKNSSAKRRIYVTPGLVEQGSETEAVHIKIGRMIAESNVDIAVIMKNSVSGYIKAGLKNGGFSGSLMEIDNPLEFYTNLEHFVAAGDVVLMQNDWTDSYR